MYTPFELDLINNMDHMRISGTEPRKVIYKNETGSPKVPIPAKAKMGRCDKATKLTFQSILDG